MAIGELATRLLRELGCPTIKPKPGKIVATCPMARWRHKGGTDSTASFALLLSSDSAGYKCLSCGLQGGKVTHLVWEVMLASRRPINKATWTAYRIDGLWRESERQEAIDPPEFDRSSHTYNPAGTTPIKKRPRARPDPDMATWEQTTLSKLSLDKKSTYEPPRESELDSYEDEIPEWAVLPFMSPDTVQAYGLRWEPSTQRVVIPVRDRGGLLLGYTKRLAWGEDYCWSCGVDLMYADKKGRRKKRAFCPRCGANHLKHWHEPPAIPRNRIVFGANVFEDGDDLVLVEGPTDVMNLYHHGVRTPVALLGASVGSTQLKIVRKLAQRAGEVVIAGDGDRGGEVFRRKVALYLDQAGQTYRVVRLCEGQDPGCLSQSEVEEHFSVDKTLTGV